MFFILSKTVSFILMPLTLIFIFFILHLVFRKPTWKRFFFWLAFGSLFFFTNDFIANEVMLRWEIPARPYSDLRPHKMAIVLTGTTMSNMVPDDRVYFHKGADRVTHTVQLYKLGLVKKILVSGGSGSLSEVDSPEANKYKEAMVMMGIPEDDILLENKTRNTYESAAAVAPMLDSMKYKGGDCILVTSAFHMRRSLAVYRKAGIHATAFTTDFYTHKPDYKIDSYLLPGVEPMQVWNRMIREWLGIAAYKAAGYL